MSNDVAAEVSPAALASALVPTAAWEDSSFVYLNVYVSDRRYGGPEEGGWWYDGWRALASIPLDAKLADHDQSTCDACIAVAQGDDYAPRCEDRWRLVPLAQDDVVEELKRRYEVAFAGFASERRHESIRVGVESEPGTDGNNHHPYE